MDPLVEFAILTGAITRQPEDHPLYEYLQIELVKENCFQNNYYARAATKYARNKDNIGHVIGYEVIDLLKGGIDSKRQLTVDCDVKICLRDLRPSSQVSGETAPFYDPNCYRECNKNGVEEVNADFGGQTEEVVYEDVPFEDLVDTNGNAYPTSTIFEPTSTSTEVMQTEELRTYNFAFKLNHVVSEKAADPSVFETEFSYHTHPYYRIFQNAINPEIPYGQIGVTPAISLNQPFDWEEAKDSIGQRFNPKDFEVDINDHDNPHFNGGLNDPKWYATVEPGTFETVTPWDGWHDGMIAHKNCIYRLANFEGDMDQEEKDKCEIVATFMAEGPDPGQAAANEQAIKDMEAMGEGGAYNSPVCCNQQMVDNDFCDVANLHKQMGDFTVACFECCNQERVDSGLCDSATINQEIGNEPVACTDP